VIFARNGLGSGVLIWLFFFSLVLLPPFSFFRFIHIIGMRKNSIDYKTSPSLTKLPNIQT